MTNLSPLFFVSLALKGAALLAIAGLVTLALRRESASIRHSVWSVSLVGVLLLPVLELVLPRWRVVSLPNAVDAVAPLWTRPPAIAAVARATTPEAPPAAIASNARGIAAAGTESDPTPVASLIFTPTPIVPAPVPLGTRLLLGWLAGSLLLLGWIVAGEWWVRRLGTSARPARAPEWTSLLPEALESLGVRHRIRVLETDRSIVPLTFGLLHPVVVLPAAGRRWSASHRRDVLLHELAHVARRDCLTHFLARVACALHWFNPLAWMAIRQLRIEREHASDDAVLNAGALPSRYAEELLSTAQAMGSVPALASAGLAMARRSELADRLFSVLDSGRARSPLDGRSLAGILTAGAALILPLGTLGRAASREAAPITARVPRVPAARPASFAPVAPGTPVAAGSALDLRPKPVRARYQPKICPPDAKGHDKTVHVSSSISISGEGNASDGKNSWVVWSGRNCSVTIRTTGTIMFDDEEHDVRSVASGGRFVITHEDPDQTRVYTVTTKGGELVREYRVDGKDAAMDGRFEQWRSDLVLEYIRRTAYDAERRAHRILASRGVDGLLAEIDEIGSGWAKGQYFRALVATSGLDDKTTARIVDQAGRSIESDYELGQVLGAVKPSHLEDEGVRQAFVRAAGTMDSDYEKRQALSKVLAAGKPSPVVTSAMLDLAATIESDYEVAELLIGVANPGSVTGALDPAYLRALATIESDYEKHRVLSALFTSGPRPHTTVEAALEVATTIGSDYELASFLVELAEKGLITKDLRPLFRRALATIESSYERQRALAALGAKDVDI